MQFETNAHAATRGVAWPVLIAMAAVASAIALANDGHFRVTHVLAIVGIMAWAVFSTVRTPKNPGRTPQAVLADHTGLSLDGTRVMDHDAIVRAYAVPCEDDRHVVHIEGRFLRTSCAVWVDSEEQSKALIAALALAQPPPSSTSRFRALPPWAKHIRSLAVILTASPWVLVNVVRVLPAWGIGLFVALYGVILLPTLLPQRVEVGHDGVFMQWLGNRRFIPFSKIETVSANKTGVVLFLQGDRHLEIRLTQKDGGADAEVHALLARIKAGMDAQRGLTHADEEALLARSGRNIDTWIREMRALGLSELGGYRAAAIPRERLWSVVENAAADPSAREGAALALSASLDDTERARILALAQNTASPRLRIALDGVGREREPTRLRIALETADAESPVEDAVSERLPAARAASSRDDG